MSLESDIAKIRGWKSVGSAAGSLAAIQTVESIEALPNGNDGICVSLYSDDAEVRIDIDSIGQITSVIWRVKD